MMAWRTVVGGASLLLLLAGCSPSTPAPSVTPTKGAATLSSPEVAEVMNDCLRDKGWEVLGGRTSTQYVGPPEQNDAFQADLFQCYEDLGFADIKAPDYTPEHLAKKYKQEQRTRACLIKQGQNVPDLPSLQAYSDMFFNEGKIYSSYEFLVTDQSASDVLRQICGDPLDTWTSDLDR